MSATSEFYLTRAAESARDAESSTLANVRDRHQRAETAWRAMADRLLKAEGDRARLAAEKAARDPV